MLKDNIYFQKLLSMEQAGHFRYCAREDNGMLKALSSWKRSVERKEKDFDLDVYLMEWEVESCIKALRDAGIKSFIFTAEHGLALKNLCQLTEAGCRFAGFCAFKRPSPDGFMQEAYGARFLISQ